MACTLQTAPKQIPKDSRSALANLRDLRVARAAHTLFEPLVGVESPVAGPPTNPSRASLHGWAQPLPKITGARVSVAIAAQSVQLCPRRTCPSGEIDTEWWPNHAASTLLHSPSRTLCCPPR